MDIDKEVHTKEFNTNMFGACFNECVSSFNSSNLTVQEGKCLKTCFVNFSKKLQMTGEGMNLKCKLAYDLK